MFRNNFYSFTFLFIYLREKGSPEFIKWRWQAEYSLELMKSGDTHMFWRGIKDYLYSAKHNYVLEMDWKHSNVNAVGIVLLLSKQLLLNCSCYQPQQPKDWTGPSTTWDKGKGINYRGGCLCVIAIRWYWHYSMMTHFRHIHLFIYSINNKIIC